MLESTRMDEIKFWVAFHRIPGIGRVRYAALQAYFGDLETAWNADIRDMRNAGINGRTLSNVRTMRPEIDPDAVMADLDARDITTITLLDSTYPERLRQIYDHPPVIYVKGALTEKDEWSIAVVGTRKPTNYGLQMANTLSEKLVRSGITVVSGLARGIDAEAHHSALQAGGRTIAIQACGLDIVYPANHGQLAQRIAESGAVISEYPLGVEPRGDFFPRRNRIMSGLSLGTLVIEADHGSGALITADCALEQDREVFAVPGTVTSSRSRGTNKLIQEGAKLVAGVDDILAELNLLVVPEQPSLLNMDQAAERPQGRRSARDTSRRDSAPAPRTPAPAPTRLPPPEPVAATDVEVGVLRHLSQEPMHIDEVIRQCELPVSTVSSTLAMMELKGIIKQVGAMNYIKVREVKPAYSA